MAHRTDEQLVSETRNTARYFTETRHVAWALLLATLLWGVIGFRAMPKRKDPVALARSAVAICTWPGASAEDVEQLVTRPIEETVARNSRVERVTSDTRTGVTVVTVRLDESVTDRRKEFDDIALKLGALASLPPGAGPVVFLKDFADTAALLLTVASPPPGEIEIELRTRAIRQQVQRARAGTTGADRVAVVFSFPQSVSSELARPLVARFTATLEAAGQLRDVHPLEGPGFIGIDGVSPAGAAALRATVATYTRDNLRSSELHPDAWGAIAFGDLDEIAEQLAASAGSKYSYRDLDRFADVIKRTLQRNPQVAKVTVSGLLDERIVLSYSQERLAGYGIRPSELPSLLGARNITVPGGVVEVGDKNVRIDPSGEFLDESEIGDVLISVKGGRSVYLRDLADISRTYALPARFQNFVSFRDDEGQWRRARAVSVSVETRPGTQIADFGESVDAALAELAGRLPEDLHLARTSDQPLQVEENISLFMSSLYEAIALVVLVALVGYWAWRPALLMATAIPLTLAMTFGMMHLLGVDLQQVSIASLIIALGLLVDDPVVAGDAIKRELGSGWPRLVASWLGPTKLAKAILYSTITNIVAYLPFLLLTAETGNFLRTMPIVIGCSLVASRIVSMSFIPLLGFYLLRPGSDPPIEERRKTGLASHYYRFGRWALRHRFQALALSFVILAVGVALMSGLKTEFFPQDNSYLSYVNISLPEDAPLSATGRTAAEVEAIIREVGDEFGRRGGKDGEPREVLASLTTYVGGGAPRFWHTLAPVQAQLNFAQILIRVHDKHDTNALVGPLQRALSSRVAGAHIDVQRLPTGSPLKFPLELRISGDDIPTLRRLAEEAKAMFRDQPGAVRVRDDWGAESFSVRLQIDADRANLAGVSNFDVAASSAIGMNGFEVATLRDGDRRIPIVARMRMDERTHLGDVQNLYVYSARSADRVPLGLVSSIDYRSETERIQRRNQFRTITVGAFPDEGVLASEVLGPMRERIDTLAASLPPGYLLEIGGAYEKTVEGFGELGVVMLISVALIFMALVVQFENLVKPFLVFAAIPYGMVGAFAALRIMEIPFGFMAFLGIASLVGVIVSNVIVLFDFIEDARERGAPLEEALLDAGLLRLQPVLIAGGSTIFALIPLAANGGPVWEPLCYAQIGGLTAATFLTLLVVPVIYAIAVLDLKIVKWDSGSEEV
jgi:multidrug efflux pump subunit AcrB